MAIEKETGKIKEILTHLIENDDRPMPHSVLFGKMVKQHKKELGFVSPELFDQALDEMIEERKIRFNSETNKYLSTSKKYDNGPRRFDDRKRTDDRRSYNDGVTIKTDEVLSGVLSLNQGGNGFITLPGELKAKYYVNKINLGTSQNGDTVEFSPTTKETKGTLIDAVISKTLQHGKDFYVGTYHDNKDGTYKIQLDDAKVTLDVELDGNDGLVEGSKILIKIGRYDGNKAYGTVSRIIGHKSDVGVDILSIVLDNGVEPDFADDVLTYAKSLKLDVNEEQLRIRHDLRQKPICTIDPATSKDFDDAFYCERLDDGRIMLSVSIADVSHYVKTDSILDKEALRRGCSIYLVDRVIPMLPHNLSDDLCSINPNVERMALTCEMIINKSGTFDDIKVFPSVIESHRRYSYDEVNQWIENKDFLKNDPQDVVSSLAIGIEVSHWLDAMKEKRGYIELNVPKAIIKVDSNCVPTEITREVHGKAQKMIENMMVAANEAVTIYADRNNFPFVYRVHDKPNADRLATFAMEAKKLNFKINTNIEDIKSKDVEQWLEDNKDNPNLDLIGMMLLRSMAKAKYSTTNIGHFGLASVNYTHFTSPIRRYPDLLVHRIFWNFDFLKETSESTKKNIASTLSDNCDTSSKNELTAQKCERDVDSMKFAEYMMKHLNEQFEVTVSNVSRFGCFVQMDNSIEGLIKTQNLGNNEYFSYNEKTMELNGKKGTRISLGTRLLAECILADKEQRKIEFRLVKLIRNR